MELFLSDVSLDNAHAHVEQAKSHASEGEYLLGRATELQARIWNQQGKFEDARSEVLRAKEIYEKLGLEKDVRECRNLLQEIEQAENRA